LFKHQHTNKDTVERKNKNGETQCKRVKESTHDMKYSPRALSDSIRVRNQTNEHIHIEQANSEGQLNSAFDQLTIIEHELI